MKATTLSTILICTLCTLLAVSLFGLAWFFELGKFGSDSVVQQTSEVRKLNNPRNLNSKQIRVMFPDPETGEPLTAIADFSQEISPDLLFCYMVDFNNPSSFICLVMGELVYDSNGNVIGNKVHEKKMQ